MFTLAEDLLTIGFIPLEKSTRCYGNGKFTGSIYYWNSRTCNYIETDDLLDNRGRVKSPFTVECFCPFLFDEKDKKNCKYKTVRLFNIEEIINYGKTLESTI